MCAWTLQSRIKKVDLLTTPCIAVRGTHIVLLRHLELGHAHVAAHAEHDAEAEARQQRHRVARAEAAAFRANVLVWTKTERKNIVEDRIKQND